LLIQMTKRFVPQGIMPALVTPFTKDGDFIEEGFRQVIDYTIEKGVDGVVPAGTTGEFVYMRTEERKKLLKLCVEFADGRVPVVAGTGQNSTRATVAMTKYAADIGCEAALIVSPFYLRPADKGYYEHYETVARQADLPVILYNIPQCTLGQLNVNVVEDLAEVDNIVGIKDTSGNIAYTLELIQKLKGKMPVLIGNDECFLPGVAAGATGGIMASANVIPHLWHEVMKSIQKGDMKRALEIQRSVQTFARLIVRYGGPSPAKAALKFMGFNVGRPRLPLDTGGTLTAETKDEIRVELEKLGIIPALKHADVSSVDIRKLLKESGADFQPEQVRLGQGSNKTVSVGVAVGSKSSSLGHAFVQLLTCSRVGHETLSVILEPNLAVRPSSIMMPAKKIETLRQASFFYGPVQSGAAKAVAAHLATGKISRNSIDNDIVIMGIDVDLNNRDRRAVTAATQDAVSKALLQIWR